MSTNSVKITFNNELRRLPYVQEKGIQGLMELCASCFNLKNINNLQLTYQDSEGDTILLSSDEELAGLFNSSQMVKLSLQRRALAKKAVSVMTNESQTASGSGPSQTSTETKKVKSLEKKDPKEKKATLKQEIISTKVVRLRWKDLNSIPASEEASKGLKKQHKGCYIGTTANGKIKFNCGLGKKGLWLSHQLADSGVMFASLLAPRRFLRVCPNGTINLSNGGFGPRTRWNMVREEGTGRVSLVSRFNNNQLGGISVSKKAKVIKDGKESKKTIARCFDLSAAPENLVIRSFSIVEVDSTQLLSKVMKGLAKKRHATRPALKKEGKNVGKNVRKNWKQQVTDQRRVFRRTETEVQTSEPKAASIPSFPSAPFAILHPAHPYGKPFRLGMRSPFQCR